MDASIEGVPFRLSLTHLKKKSELERNDIAIYTYILHLTWKDLEFVALDGL